MARAYRHTPVAGPADVPNFRTELLMLVGSAETMLFPRESLRRHDSQNGQIVRDVMRDHRGVITGPLMIVELHLHLRRRKVPSLGWSDDVVGRGDVKSSAALADDEAEADFGVVRGGGLDLDHVQLQAVGHLVAG